MEWAIVLPLVAFALLAGLFALFLRRAGRLIAATRDVERFRRQIADLVVVGDLFEVGRALLEALGRR